MPLIILNHHRSGVVLDLAVQQLVHLPVALLALDAAVTRHPARPAELELVLLFTPAKQRSFVWTATRSQGQ